MSASTGNCLTVPPEGEAVAPPVVGAPGGTSLVGRVAPGAEASVALASRGESSELAVLVGGVAHPVDAGVVADGGVCRVDENDFEILVG